MNTRKEIVPNNLKEVRIRCGYTQKKVLQLLGFTNEVSLCHWENGKNVPGLINLFKLSRIYNTSPEELYREVTQSLLMENYSDN